MLTLQSTDERTNLAVIGGRGFVGSCLARQVPVDQIVGRDDFEKMLDIEYSTVVCCAAPAQKWIANRAPAEDLANIRELIANLARIRTRRFVLVSTVDVFSNPVGVDEDSAVHETGLHAYGLHRRLLEKFVQNHFAGHLVVRLPGLVGPGLKKNVIYDFHHENNVHLIDSRGIFQFYPMVNLWSDIQTALDAQLSLIHLTSAPFKVADIATLAFNQRFNNCLANPPAQYDMRTVHAARFGVHGHYQYSQRESILAIRGYAQSEPIKKRVSAEVLW